MPEISALTLAQCPTLPASIPLHARVLVGGDTAQSVSNACELTVALSAQSGAYSVTGACANIPSQSAPLVLILQWYVVGPATGSDVLLAEVQGSVKATGDKQTYLADFSTLPIKTKGASTDDPSERDRFNCDRTGVSACDSSSAPAVVTQDVDTCSNLEELCKDTLFKAQSTSDSCP